MTRQGESPYGPSGTLGSDERRAWHRNYLRARRTTRPASANTYVGPSRTISEGVKASWEHRPRADRSPGWKRRQQLLYRYDLTEEQFNAMVDAQHNCCAICQKALARRADGKTQFHVDHDHATRRVRGLLCMSCNTHLGWLERFESVIQKYK